VRPSATLVSKIVLTIAKVKRRGSRGFLQLVWGADTSRSDRMSSV
jgi:hypothetical protein